VEIDLFEEVYRLTRQIPKGKVSTYGAIAKALGDIRASRAVGFALNQNPNPDFTPCYKVVNSDGTLGGFGLGIEEKIRRLEKDGIKVIDGKIVNFDEVFFDNFVSEYPLKRLRKEQLELSKKVRIEDDFDDIETIGGLDVAYSSRKRRLACAACVIMDRLGNVMDRVWITDEIKFPYVPTYLAYRELPLFEKLINRVKERPSIFLVDGNGILHPYRIGIASHLGIVLDIPTIGVAKNLLHGEIEGRYIFDKGEKIGYVLYSSKRPIFISPGHRVSMETSIDIVKIFLKYRIPEPLRQAHILAKSKIKEIDQQI